MSKPYTLGPWRLTFSITANNWPYARLDGAKRYYDKQTGLGFDIGGVISEADARMMVAAPDMYEALKAMYARWEPDVIGTDRVMWENAGAAIRKAEGREP